MQTVTLANGETREVSISEAVRLIQDSTEFEVEYLDNGECYRCVGINSEPYNIVVLYKDL